MIPLVSVHIVTYNHKDYISKTINSVLEQRVNFSIEIVIGDDFSTDGTREILLDFHSKYPKEIILNLLPEKGKGMIGRENYETTTNLCKGKYIAFLDGDDYWSDPDKLQTQVDFLQDNSSYVMCHHDCSSKSTPGIEFKKAFSKRKPITNFYDACQITIPFMSSVVIRKESLTFYDRNYWLEDLDLGDFVLWAMAALKGKAYFIDKEMGFYRVSSTGVTKILDLDIHVINRIKFVEKLIESGYSVDLKFLKRFLCKYYFLYSGYCLSKKNLQKSIKYLGKSIGKYIGSISFGAKKIDWVDRLRWHKMVYSYLLNIYKIAKAQ